MITSLSAALLFFILRVATCTCTLLLPLNCENIRPPAVRLLLCFILLEGCTFLSVANVAAEAMAVAVPVPVGAGVAVAVAVTEAGGGGGSDLDSAPDRDNDQ